MKKILIMAVAMTVAAAYTAQGQAWTWEGGTSETNWTDASAWSVTQDPEDPTDYGDYPGHKGTQGLVGALNGKVVDLVINTEIPNALGDYSNFGTDGASAGSKLTITSTGSLTVADPWIGRNSGTYLIDVNGGSLTTSGTNTRIASGNTGHTATKGWITVRGSGTATVDSPNLLMGVNAEQTSIVTIQDGTFTFGGTTLSILNPGDNMHITLNHLDSIFRWNGNQVTAINTLIGNTGIRAGTNLSWKNDGPVYDEDLGYTELRVIPEPGTIALLGLAGLALLVRRRFVK